jgi:hypothetical protein
VVFDDTVDTGDRGFALLGIKAKPEGDEILALCDPVELVMKERDIDDAGEGP